MVEPQNYGFASEQASQFPPYIMYDVINVCNARCSHCPQRIISRQQEYTAMRISWEQYIKTIEEIARHRIDVLRLTGDGEPLLHPDIARMVRAAKEAGVPKVNLTTNGSLLKGRLLDDLLESPPDIFDISLDAFYAETYQEVRAGLDFESVKANVLNLLDRRDSARSKVIVSFIRRPGADQEAEAFTKYWQPLVDFVAIREMHSNKGLSNQDSSSSDVERWPCQHLWQRLVFDYRGMIRYCPVDWTGESVIGEIDRISIQEAWQSEKMKALRENHLNGSFESCGPCNSCQDWQVSPWDKGWLKLVEKISADDRFGHSE